MTENKIRILVLILGTVFACTAPFMHILYPRVNPTFKSYDQQLENKILSDVEHEVLTTNLKEKEVFFGFNTKRKFWYAIGKPISMLYFALLFIYIYPYIEIEKYVKRVIAYSAALFLFISLYFIIWTFWYRLDFPIVLYYVAIGVGSIVGTAISIVLINHKKTMVRNVHSLLRFIVTDIKEKYISLEDKTEFVDDYTDEIEKLKN